jgi:NAD(P)-dependent dehydrogenase (short-subunit alcohol dehydrogenase family)
MPAGELFDLRGRGAIVTGGAGLLGREFVRTLAEAGATVAVADQDGDAARQAAAEVEGVEGRTVAFETDVTSHSSLRHLVDGLLQEVGRIDILVNSAALDPKFDADQAAQHTHNFETFPIDAWNRALEVNLTGPFLACQAVAGHMVGQRRGSIINICSTYGLVGPDQRIYEQPGRPPRYKPVYYSVTKAGILGLTRYLATYFAGTNIRVNALSPGGVYTNQDEQFVRNYAARTVLGRMASKDEMNGALLFLASDASSYMTGANLVVDGGWTAW